MQRNQKVKKIKYKICKGDKVIAIRGNDRGQVGVVLRCNGQKVLVQGLNIRKKHVKKSENNPSGAIIDIERPIHVSNLRVCVEDEPVKLYSKRTDEGAKGLYYVKKDKETLYRELKKPTK